MALEDDTEEDCIIRSVDGGMVFRFNSPEHKAGFIKHLTHLAVKSDAIKGEGYKCGNCAAYPCFRGRGESEHAGLCFQPTRRCRQECDSYAYSDDCAAGGGICKKDRTSVRYEQDCHIPEMRTQANKKAR